jgi:hypothetical protein
MEFVGILRLMKDARFAAVVAKTRGRNLAAGVAVDATFVDVKLTFYILRKPLVNLRHKFALLPADFRRSAEVALPGLLHQTSLPLPPKYLIILPA